MPISLWLVIPLAFLWTLGLNAIANFLINQRFKTTSFPLFEVVGTTILIAVSQITDYPLYFLFCSALLIVIHTDFSSMLISRYTTLYLVPTGILASHLGYLPIDTTESISAACAGYGLLWIINKLFYALKKIDGIGQGDLELMALIGSYTGILGCWFSILFGSIVGTIVGSLYLLYTRQKTLIMPFGVFLSLGTIVYILIQDHIIKMLIL